MSETTTPEIDLSELEDYTQLPGGNFLKPPKAVRMTVRGRLIGKLQALSDEASDDLDLDPLMDLIEFIEKYCSLPGFGAWLDGEDADGEDRMLDAIKLAIAYAQELGKAFTRAS